MNKRKPGYKQPTLVLFELTGWFQTLLAVVGAPRTVKPNIRENTWKLQASNEVSRLHFERLNAPLYSTPQLPT